MLRDDNNTVPTRGTLADIGTDDGVCVVVLPCLSTPGVAEWLLRDALCDAVVTVFPETEPEVPTCTLESDAAVSVILVCCCCEDAEGCSDELGISDEDWDDI